MSEVEAVARFFRAQTGLEPQLVTDVRRGAGRRTNLAVWSIMTELGHFYVVRGRHGEVIRGSGPQGRPQRAQDACRVYLELHPDESPPG